MDTSPSDKVAQPKHTPGPWHVDPDHKMVVKAGNTHIAAAGARPGYNPLVIWAEQQANAALIAASPIMYEKLKLIAIGADICRQNPNNPYGPEFESLYQYAVEAIAAVEGAK